MLLIVNLSHDAGDCRPVNSGVSLQNSIPCERSLRIMGDRHQCPFS